MSKRAEEAALKAYPETLGIQGNGNAFARHYYVDGYEQAEKDLALSWEDVKLLCDCFMDVGLHSELPARSKSLYEEVLARFNKQRQK